MGFVTRKRSKSTIRNRGSDELQIAAVFLTKICEESTAGKANKEGRFFFSCIMDETQDIRRREQVSLCLRYVDSKLQPAEILFGFYHAKKTDAGSLLDILKSALEELHLPFCNLRGQGYYGAASTSGK